MAAVVIILALALTLVAFLYGHSVGAADKMMSLRKLPAPPENVWTVTEKK
jgi:hypothetical protein